MLSRTLGVVLTGCPDPTDRLRFRHYRLSDVDAVIEMFSDDEARRWYPTTADADASLGWIEWNLGNYDRDGFGLWAIEDRSTGAFLGDCGLTYQDVDTDSVLEIGYHLVARHRGHGYAVEAARGCRDHAFDRLRADVVCSIVDAHNHNSQRVAAAVHRKVRDLVKPDGRLFRLYWSERRTSAT